jgi:hypothetical protein
MGIQVEEIFHELSGPLDPWVDQNQLLDVDTPEDYQKFLKFGDNA